VVFGTIALAENMQLNISRNFGETEQYLMRNLLYTGAFAHCANWLVKLTPGMNFIKIFGTKVEQFCADNFL
jgi:hypothetical protein